MIMLHSLTERVLESFSTRFCSQPMQLVQAPGRVNLIGEHTDYNEGFVLPCTINYHTVVAASRRHDKLVQVWAADYMQSDIFDLEQPIIFNPQQPWSNYIRGVIASLQQQGYPFAGMDLVVGGNIPQGAGLSSSASLEVAIGQSVKALYSLSISQQQIALTGQQAENQFVGCQCGIMDQLISACGQKDHALLIDCRSLAMQPVPLAQEIVVMIINFNKSRGLVESEYNSRRQQCETAAQILGVKALRDVTSDMLQNKIALLDPLTARRARHVITENARTLAAAQALEKGDLKRLGQLMAQSHASMRDNFQITVPEIDILVQIVQNTIRDIGGVRMTGGGFGGCVVALLRPEQVDNVQAAIAAQYEQKTGLQATIYLTRASQGASTVQMG